MNHKHEDTISNLCVMRNTKLAVYDLSVQASRGACIDLNLSFKFEMRVQGVDKAFQSQTQAFGNKHEFQSQRSLQVY